MDSILIIDTGSSSMRGIIFTRDGSILYSEQRKYFMHVDGDLAEQEAETYRSTLMDICRSCAVWANENHSDIKALGFTSQRSSILPLDEEGKPLHNIITWYDKRSSKICQEMQERHGDVLYSITGTRPTPVLSAPKMIWLKENKPEIYEKAYKIVGIHDYLIYLCSGKMVTDASLGSRSLLMDIRNLTWSDELLGLFNLDKEKLCPILSPGSPVGKIDPAFAEETSLPKDAVIITAGGDQQCSVLGQGLFNAGSAGVTVGTGAYLASVSDRPIFDSRQRVNLNAAITPGCWILEASTLSSGSVYDWYHRTFYPEEKITCMDQINREVHESPLGAHGVIMLPDLGGRGCPEWNTLARGNFFNISFSSTRGDCARALLEGIASEINDCHKVLLSLDSRINAINATGGLTKFNDFVQMLADMTKLPINRCTQGETTAIGAFLATSTALSWYSSQEEAYTSFSENQRKKNDVFQPILENSHLYAQINEVRAKLLSVLPHEDLHGILSLS